MRVREQFADAHFSAATMWRAAGPGWRVSASEMSWLVSRLLAVWLFRKCSGEPVGVSPRTDNQSGHVRELTLPGSPSVGDEIS